MCILNERRQPLGTDAYAAQLNGSELGPIMTAPDVVPCVPGTAPLLIDLVRVQEVLLRPWQY